MSGTRAISTKSRRELSSSCPPPPKDKVPKVPTSTLIRSGRLSAMGGGTHDQTPDLHCTLPETMFHTHNILRLVPGSYWSDFAVPWPQWPVVGLSPRKAMWPCLTRTPVYMGFMVGKVTLRHDILRVLRLPPVRIIPPVLYDIFSNTYALLRTAHLNCRKWNISVPWLPYWHFVETCV